MARAEAQAGNNPQVPGGTVEPFLTPDGIGRFINGPTDTSIDTRMRMQSRLKDATLKNIGGTVEEDSNGKKTWVVSGRSYLLPDSRVTTRPTNGHTGGMRGVVMGEATMEGPHHPYPALQNPDIARALIHN